MSDHAAQVYRPSLVLHFRLRFDETLQRLETPTPDTVAKRLAGGASPAQAGLPMALPLFIGADVGDGLSHVLNVSPTKAQASLNGHRKAATWSASIAFRDLPIDPRVVSAGAVLVHLGAVADSDFSDGMERGASAAVRRRAQLDTFDAAGNPDPNTLLMVGTIDIWRVRHTNRGSVAEVQGRDLTGMLLDSPTKAGTAEVLNLAQPIGDVVKQILSLHPYGNDIVPFVRVAPAIEWPGGVEPSPAFDDQTTRVRRGAKGEKKPRAGSKSGASMNFWDYITQVCTLVGAVPRFVGQYLRVDPARSLYDQAVRAGASPANPTPFAGGGPRTLSDGTQLRTRRIVYGRDIEEFEMARKLGGVKARVVEVVALDTSSTNRGAAKMLRAHWPPVDADEVAALGGKPIASDVAPSGTEAKQEPLRIRVPAVRDISQLQTIARALFDEIMRGEITGSVKTRNLASLGGDAADPDMLRLRPGDAIEVAVDVRHLSAYPPVISELTDHSRRSFEEQVAAVAAKLGDDRIARVIVASARGLLVQPQQVFCVEGVVYQWDIVKGVDIEAAFANFFEARLGGDA